MRAGWPSWRPATTSGGPGITLRRVGEGWRLYTREEHAAVVERYLVDGQRSRLTQAALETLAVIAYRQPVTRARVPASAAWVWTASCGRCSPAAWCTRWAPIPTAGAASTRRRRCSSSGSASSLADLPELAPLLPETSTMLDEHPDS